MPIHYFVAVSGYHSYLWHIVLWYTSCRTLVLHIRDLILSRPTVGSLDHRRSLQGIVYCLEGRNGAFNGKMSNVSKKTLCVRKPSGRRAFVCLASLCVEARELWERMSRQDFVPPRFSDLPHTPPPTSPTPPPSYLSRSTPSEIIESHTHVDISSSFNILFPKGQTRVTMMIESLQDILLLPLLLGTHEWLKLLNTTFPTRFLNAWQTATLTSHGKVTFAFAPLGGNLCDGEISSRNYWEAIRILLTGFFP